MQTWRAEVVVDNKDIGFVHPATGAHQARDLSLHALRHDDATVKSVTADAVNDEKRGAIFPATLTLDRRNIDVDGKRIGLGPGMNVTAEIKTGRRHIIEYLLSPVEAALKQSLRER